MTQEAIGNVKSLLVRIGLFVLFSVMKNEKELSELIAGIGGHWS